MIRQHLLPLTKENANEQYVPSSPISLGPLGLLGPLRPLRGRVSEIVRNHLNCLNRLIGLNGLYPKPEWEIRRVCPIPLHAAYCQ